MNNKEKLERLVNRFKDMASSHGLVLNPSKMSLLADKACSIDEFECHYNSRMFCFGSTCLEYTKKNGKSPCGLFYYKGTTLDNINSLKTDERLSSIPKNASTTSKIVALLSIVNVMSNKDIIEALRCIFDVDESSVPTLLNNLLKRSKIVRVGRGLYSLNTEYKIDQRRKSLKRLQTFLEEVE